MKNNPIKKNDKVCVTFGEDNVTGVVIDICPASRWSSVQYLVMFKNHDDVHLSTWYDAYRVSLTEDQEKSWSGLQLIDYI